ncbi:cell division cycle-related protein [Rhizina undulata]
MIATATASHSPLFSPSSPTRIERTTPANGSGGYGSLNGGTRQGTRTTGRSNFSHHASQNSTAANGRRSPHRREVMGREEIPQVPSRMFVRALYNYSADDPTSLSFSQGDVIQVLTQLESGWWDGIVHGQRGWFPSNYCAIISGNDVVQNGNSQSPLDDSDDLEEDDSYDDYDDDDDDSGRDGPTSPGLPMEGTDDRENDEAAFWIPQATSDGRLYYFNTITGVAKMELPLETPTSTTETGPRDRSNFSAPEQTRPPAELMARGYEREEPAYHDFGDDDSASDREGDMLVLSMHSPSRDNERQSFISEVSSSAGSTNSSVSPPERESQTTLAESTATSIDSARNFSNSFKSPSFSTPPATAASNLKTSGLLTINQSNGATTYYEDNIPTPHSWDELVENTRLAVERYRHAINTRVRAHYVARAEDISDMLRLLIAAGSSTTDNHSGQPSVISSNKALHPHYRHFMAAFSKLVLSSHVAATDCPPQDAESKCLAEADEVMVGVFDFAKIAREQKGEKLPRLKPGFVHGSHDGGGWRPIGGEPEVAPSPKIPDMADQSPEVDPTIALNAHLTDRMEELNGVVKPALRRLESTLDITETIVTDQQQAIIGANVISAAYSAFDAIKNYFHIIDNINLAPLLQTPQSPTLMDFLIHKQRLHDHFADLFLACQSVTAPLADEWTCIRGEPLEDRLNFVRVHIKGVESGISTLNFTTQMLVAERESQEPEDDIQTEDLRKAGDTSPIDVPNRGTGHLRRDSRPTIPMSDRLKVERLTGERLTATDKYREEKPWYLECDNDKEIVYNQKQHVKGGTLAALVERVTRHDMLDSNFISTFLLTYQSFTTATELFNELVKRFTIQCPAGLTATDFKIWTEKKQKLIRVRVLSILKIWLEQHWMEGLDDGARDLLKKMYTFAKDVMLPQLSGTNRVMELIETRLEGREPEMKRMVLNMVSQPPPPILPKSLKKLKFLDVDALEFARQLTIIESRSYGKLKPTECLSKGWSKQPVPGCPDPAENIRSIIMQSNRLTNWVAELILGQTEVRKRVIVIKHFIAIAEKCRLLNNFSTLTAILAALQTASIHRLKRTWEHVPTRTSTILGQMNTLMGATMNFAEYREMLHIVNPPCVPFLGVYLKDLTFVADGNDDYIKGTDQLINFGKRSKTATIIREIQQYQSVPYALQPVPELIDWITQQMVAARDVNEMYETSLSLEPREREDEKIARLLQESGFL